MKLTDLSPGFCQRLFIYCGLGLHHLRPFLYDDKTFGKPDFLWSVGKVLCAVDKSILYVHKPGASNQVLMRRLKIKKKGFLFKKKRLLPCTWTFYPEKNMYLNAYMDFLSEPEFTFSAFWKKKALFIHPTITQIWAGPRSKIKKEDAVAQNFDQES
jgi:hypothetical protein